MGTMADVQFFRLTRDGKSRQARAHTASVETSPWRANLRPAEAATLLGWILVVAIIAYSYLNGSTGGPYGTCYAPSGRGVPCELVGK